MMASVFSVKTVKKILIVISLIVLLIGSLTFVMTWQNIGFGEKFVSQWLSSLLLAATTMAPLGFVMVALVTKVVSLLMPQATEVRRNFVIGLSMAIIMEGAMALVTTLNNTGTAALSEIAREWLQAFAVALPLGLLISVLMTMVIKPRIERIMAS